jgi:hypothetical protein
VRAPLRACMLYSFIAQLLALLLRNCGNSLISRSSVHCTAWLKPHSPPHSSMSMTMESVSLSVSSSSPKAASSPVHPGSVGKGGRGTRQCSMYPGSVTRSRRAIHEASQHGVDVVIFRPPQMDGVKGEEAHLAKPKKSTPNLRSSSVRCIPARDSYSQSCSQRCAPHTF